MNHSSRCQNDITTASRYDPNGNPQRHVHGGAGEMLYAYYAGTNEVSNTDGAGSDYRYDGNGNTTYSNTLDPAGSTTITYDLFSGLPTRVTAPDGAGSRTATTYRYTSDGERVLKAGEAGGYETRTFYVRGLASYPVWVSTCTDVGSGDGSSYWSCDGMSHVRGPAGLLVETRLPYRRPDGSVDPNQSFGPGGSPPEMVRYGVADHLGSVRALVAEQAAGGAGEVWQDYAPFGAVMRGVVTGVEGRYGYTGQEADAESGLLNYRARLYDAGLGRFYATDPAGEFHSPYSYVGNNPASFTDPTGMFVAEILTVAKIGFDIYSYYKAAKSVYTIADGFNRGGLGGGMQAFFGEAWSFGINVATAQVGSGLIQDYGPSFGVDSDVLSMSACPKCYTSTPEGYVFNGIEAVAKSLSFREVDFGNGFVGFGRAAKDWLFGGADQQGFNRSYRYEEGWFYAEDTFWNARDAFRASMVTGTPPPVGLGGIGALRGLGSRGSLTGFGQTVGRSAEATGTIIQGTRLARAYGGSLRVVNSEMRGGLGGAKELFRQLTGVTPAGNQIITRNIAGMRVTFRPWSSSGPPTVDVIRNGIYEKIRFL